MQPTNNMSSHSAGISGVEVELGFVGDGKVFVKVEKQEDNSEKLMIYEAKNAFTGFFLNLFRDRKTTFTAREWAAKSQKKMPSDIDKEKLIKNIKTAVSSSNIQKAREIFNKLVTTKKLDTSGAEAEVAEYLYTNPLYKPGRAATTPPSSQEASNTATENELNLPVTVESEPIRDTPLSQDELGEKIWVSIEQLSKIGASKTKHDFFKNTRLNLDSDSLRRFELLMMYSVNVEFTKHIAGFLLLPSEESKEATSGKKCLQAYVQVLMFIESNNKTENPSPEQVRYLNTLKRIEENLNKQSNPAAVTNAS